jgi:hypothetical protein
VVILLLIALVRDDYSVGVNRSRLVPCGTMMVTTLALIAVGWGPACPAIGVMAFWLLITVEGFPVPLVHWVE